MESRTATTAAEAGAGWAPLTPVETVITPRAPGPLSALAESWSHRRLVPYFARRAVEKRYLRTWIGWAWVPLRPLLEIGSRILLFGGLLGVPSQGIPYPLFFLVGMTAWQLLDRTAFWAMRSLEMNRSLLRRVYVPRLTVVVGGTAPSFAEVLVYTVITIVLLLGYWIGDGTLYLALGSETLLAVAGVALIVGLALSLGMVLAVYAAQARDVRFLFGYVMGFWLLLTPVLYPLAEVPQIFQTIAQFNPMTAPIEMVKYGLLGVGQITAASVTTTLVALVAGGAASVMFFNASEARTVDTF